MSLCDKQWLALPAFTFPRAYAPWGLEGVKLSTWSDDDHLFWSEMEIFRFLAVRERVCVAASTDSAVSV